MRIISLSLATAFTVLAAAAFAQTDATKGYTGASAPGGTPPTPYSTGADVLPQIDDGKPGMDVAAPDGSTKTVRPVPCSVAAQETDGSTTCIGIEAETKRRP
jgi:hypothetical protein